MHYLYWLAMSAALQIYRLLEATYLRLLGKRMGFPGQ
jgi:hypothetical protein